jgi:rhodanese-related sulfurtransferase
MWFFGPKAPAITVRDLHDKHQAREKFFLLDVRTPEEFEAGRIEFADTLIPFDQLSFNMAKLPTDKEIPVYSFCRSGRRSAVSTQYLRSIGYTNAFNVSGGILEWIKSGYEVKSGPIKAE